MATAGELIQRDETQRANPSAPDPETVRMLFQVHHDQLTEKRQKIHAITERTCGVLLLIAGWLVASERAITTPLRWCLVFGIVVIAAVSTQMLNINNRAYLQIARVVHSLNTILGVYAQDKFIAGKSLYPREWEMFGRAGNMRTILHHWLAVWAIAAVCIAAALLSAH